jgi:hypothetical protein
MELLQSTLNLRPKTPGDRGRFHARTAPDKKRILINFPQARKAMTHSRLAEAQKLGSTGDMRFLIDGMKHHKKIQIYGLQSHPLLSFPFLNRRD